MAFVDMSSRKVKQYTRMWHRRCKALSHAAPAAPAVKFPRCLQSLFRLAPRLQRLPQRPLAASALAALHDSPLAAGTP